MDDLDQVFRAADQAGVRLALPPERVTALRGDAVLFDAVQVPIVAMSVLACVVGKRGGEPVPSLGARVGNTLMAAFPAFSRVGRYFQWSIRVRTVTADAIAFLEQTGLVVVATDDTRKVALTVRGREFVQKVRGGGEPATLFQLLSFSAARTRNDELRLL
jgi:hypothetical protein